MDDKAEILEVLRKTYMGILAAGCMADEDGKLEDAKYFDELAEQARLVLVKHGIVSERGKTSG